MIEALFPRPREYEQGELGSGGIDATALRSGVDPELPAQGFALRVDREGAELRFADPAGRRYGQRALEQLRRTWPGGLPNLRVRDWPDFAVRGYMLDVSRDRVPTRETLERIVDLLDLCRINHLQLYTEHTYAYREHEEVWKNASPITPADVRWLDDLCAERGIELCPNQNAFGHMGRWLAHQRYRARAEAPEGWTSRAQGRTLPPGVLYPDEDNARFIGRLFDELLPAFRSRRVNINCDETFELGRGRSAERAASVGTGRIYVDFLRRIMEPLHVAGHEVLFWGDIIRSHPEWVGELRGGDSIALAWHYEAPGADAPDAVVARLADLGTSSETLRGFVAHVDAFAESDFPFWVCPGTSSWNSLIGRHANARANLADAARVGLERSAGGYLITDWGDNGHLQPPSVSFAPLVQGAGQAWCAATNTDLDVAKVLDREVFDDPSGTLGRTLLEMGDFYSGTGLRLLNASPIATALFAGGLPGWGEFDAAGLERTLARMEDADAALARARPRCGDAEITVREARQALRLARHGAWRMAAAAERSAPDADARRADLREAIAEQRACWLERSRPGGLEDSVARLERVLQAL